MATAQKRVELLQDTPVPVTALSPTALIERNQPRLQDYYPQVPGLSLNVEGDGTVVLAMRGIVTDIFSNPTVAVAIDDVPFGSSTALAGGQLLQPDLDPSDLQRVEVLRGPQGTLYGASSLGGLVKYVTAAPSTGRFVGRVQADVNAVEGGDAGYGLRSAVNLPLDDTLAVRASGFTRRTAGVIDNIGSGEHDIDTVDVAGGRLSLLWALSDRLTLKLGAMHQYTHGRAESLVETNHRQRPILGDLNQSLLPESGKFKTRSTLFTANVDFALGWADLKSITGYGRNSYRSRSDRSALLVSYAPNAELGNDMRTSKFSQELRLSSPAEQPFGWLIGGFYTRERSLTLQTIDAVEAVTGKFVENLLTAHFPTTYEEAALFGDATVHVTPRLNVQAGIRYSRNHQSYRETDTGPRGEIAPGVPFFASASSGDHSVTYLVTSQYRFSRHLMVYLRVASGYRPGGPNGSAGLFGLPKTFGADTTMNYEIGLKGNVPDGWLTYELSGYYIDWRSIQLRVTDAATQFSYFTNGGRARSTGVEAALQLQPSQDLRIAASASYNNAAFSKDPPPSILADRGDRLPFGQRFGGSLSADQDFPLNDRWTAFLGGTLSYVGRRLGAFPFRPGALRVELPSYTTVDLRAGARTRDWTVNLFVRNIFDRRGVLASTPQAPHALVTGSYNTNFIQPRALGMSAVRSF